VTVKWLLKHRKDLETSLHGKKHQATAEWLSKQKKDLENSVYIDAQCNKGQSALINAVTLCLNPDSSSVFRKGMFDIVKTLLEAGASPFLRDKSNNCALSLVIENNKDLNVTNRTADTSVNQMLYELIRMNKRVPRSDVEPYPDRLQGLSRNNAFTFSP
jgi:ankyrin repeat protein